MKKINHNKALGLYLTGLCDREIGKNFNASASGICAWRRRNGLIANIYQKKSREELLNKCAKKKKFNKTIEGKEILKKYREKDSAKEWSRKYRQTQKRKDAMKLSREKPESITHKKEYDKKYWKKVRKLKLSSQSD